MKAITTQQAIRMTQQQRAAYMTEVKAALMSGKISRDEANKLRQPIRKAIEKTF